MEQKAINELMRYTSHATLNLSDWILIFEITWTNYYE